MPVAHEVGERVHPGITGGGGVGDHAVRQLNRSVGVRAQGHRDDAERVAVHVGVVGQERRDRDAEGDSGRCDDQVGVGDRRVVDRQDRQAGGPDVGVERPVVGLEGEAVRPVVVRHRRVLVRSVGVEAQGSVHRGGDKLISQARAVDVAGQHLAVDDGVLISRGRTVGGHGGVVHRVDGQVDARHVAVERAVVGLEGEGVGAIEVRGRSVDVRPVGVERDGPILWPVDQYIGQGVAVQVSRRRVT